MADSSTNYIYTIGSYATLVGLGYAIYHVSTQRTNKRPSVSVTKGSKNTQPEPRKEDRKKKQRMESFASVAQESSIKTPTAKADAAESVKSEASRKVKDTSADDGLDNREFARQLAKAQQGKQFVTNADSGKKREKSIKQSRANKLNKPEEKKPSPPSSTTGGEADDDQSSATSPEALPADVSGVADMLEPLPSTGPSVLRFTDTTEKKSNKKQTKPAEQVESKKQRQNKKKAEAAREARVAQEEERKVLAEKQRRTARIAEGRAAKDGSQFMAAAKKTSSWDQGAPQAEGSSSTQAQASINGHHQLLDTFDEPVAAAKPAQAAKQTTSDAWISSLPSEEEQMELLKNDADDWNTVKPKSKKGTKKPSAESGDEAVKKSAPAVTVEPTPVAARPAPVPKTSQSFGSFSALTKDEPTEEVEEEWDV